MPTLSIVKMDFVKVAKWGAIAIGVLIALFILVKILFFIKELIFPSPPPPPTVSFGKLPAVFFPDSINKSFTYEVDTVTGVLPTFAPSTKVYKMEQKGPDILAVERASSKLAGMGFDSRPQQISDFVYKWRNNQPPQQNLILNIKLAEFNLSSSFLSYEDKIKNGNFTNKSVPIQSASGFIREMGLYPEDLDEEKTSVDFSILNNGIISPTTRIVNSNLATVYFFQKDKDDVPIVYPQGSKSTMRLVVVAGSLMGIVVDGKFSHQNVLDESATYPIKTAGQAFDELKNGKAYVASHDGTDTKVLIKKVYLALYSEGRLQQYMTPVIVFEGSNDFVAFVPAITDEWINK